MIIIDGSWSFDTDKMIEYANKDERTSYERDMLNAFNRYAYWQYCRIRDCVNSRKCKRLTLKQVRDKLTDESKLNFTTNLLKVSKEEVFFILDFVDSYIEKIV